MREADGRGGSFVAVRDRRRGHFEGEGAARRQDQQLGSEEAVCAHRRDSDPRLLFDLTPSQEALRTLWSAAYPGAELAGLISDKWREMGWQGKDPSTDFRGGGFISLENLLFFSINYPIVYFSKISAVANLRSRNEKLK